MKTVVVLAGGPDVPASIALPAGAMVIGADGGAGLGVTVDLAVGDFDSLDAEALAGLDRVERHPADKDATDLALALDAALRESAERILVVGSAGGRLDHLFGSLLLLASDDYAGIEIDAQLGDAAVHVVRGTRRLRGEVGELVSLFAVHGPASDVVTEGLAYPLRGETLEPGSSRGTSNVFASPEATVSVGSGVVVAVRPNGSCAAGTAS